MVRVPATMAAGRIAMTARDRGTTARHLNRLAEESSPYLLQHAENPVDWYPWGEEAFEKAAREDKPVFLSIGYSTCHWCHVMEHESFEDTEVAKLLNEHFVCIKVDREERPDIDGVYMTVCQMLTGSGGWPLTIFMSPERKPFHAATYVPKHSRFGRIGMIELLPRVATLWKAKRGEVTKSADEIVGLLGRTEEKETGYSVGENTLTLAFKQLSQRYDAKHGGFGDRPKFPTPHNLMFLLRYWHRTGDESALGIVENTLEQMRFGGIYDHIGFGFHRYSTDEKWLVPHFEKMLYDQAMLAMTYTEAFQATRKPEYERTAREVISYVMRDMTSAEGGFYSAEDADSEGVEGKFYLWTLAELKEALGQKDAEFIAKTFNVTEDGNYSEEATGQRTGESILHLTSRIADPKDAKRIEKLRRKLFDHREKRVHPHKDDKVLTDWNGLMIAALAKAAAAFDEPGYAEAAKKAADFVLAKLSTDNGRLLHRYRNGYAGVTANLDDYAFMVRGLIELYEATFETKYLHEAVRLNDILVSNFWDEEAGGLFFTADDAERLLVRRKEVYDGAVPSGNSVALMNLLRLSRMTGKGRLEEMADKLVRAFSSDVATAPIAYTQFMSAIDFAVGPSREVVIAGELSSSDTKSLIDAIRHCFIPRKILLHRPPEDSPEIAEIASFVSAQKTIDGRATAYVCEDFACNKPVNDPSELLEQLGIRPRKSE